MDGWMGLNVSTRGSQATDLDGTVIDVNQLTSNLSEAIAGLQAHQNAGTPITHIELGNEMCVSYFTYS